MHDNNNALPNNNDHLMITLLLSENNTVCSCKFL